MTAVSPYAPAGRRHSLFSSGSNTKSALTVTAFVALAIRFWRLRQDDDTSDESNLAAADRCELMLRRVYKSLFGVSDSEDGIEMWPQHALLLRLRKTLGFEWLWGLVRRIMALPQEKENATPADDASNRSTPQSQMGGLDMLRQSRSQMNAILNYWFGQYSPDQAQKKLWMIASSSGDQRGVVDEDIATKFTSIILELAANDSALLQQWSQVDLFGVGYQAKVAAIIALDQMSRHVRRHYETCSSNGECVSCPLPAQSTLDTIAFNISRQFGIEHAKELSCGMVPIPMYIFGIMPYRHASTISTVGHVQERVEMSAALHEEMNHMVCRFRKATNRRMAILQDAARRSKQPTEDLSKNSSEVGDASSKNSLSENCQSHAETEVKGEKDLFSDEDILEAFAFDADMSSGDKDPVIKSMKAFLGDRGIYSAKPMPKQIEKCPSPTTESESTPIIVSLSGGVDSMVIASGLAYLKAHQGYNISIVAIHIDYANRPESGAEAEYTRRYCDSLGIEWKCRKIDQVTRGITARDEYERISRDIRYDFYRTTVKECIAGQMNKDVEVGVMLGHHRGDLRENVLSNAHKGCGPLDLSGMTSMSQNDGVTIYRPLLSLEKSSIFDYAHKYGVPYFKDTTPHWSTRGKLRNKLVPLLEEIYGEGSMNNLSNLATESDEARGLLRNSILQPFLDSVCTYPMGISFETAPWKDRPFFFWKLVLREALHGAGRGMFSDKCVASFLERVQAHTLRSGWLQCRRDYAVYLESDGKVFVFHPESFPFRKADQYILPSLAVEYGSEHATSFGPWKVVAEPVSLDSVKNELHAQELLEKKAVPSINMFMKGSISYFLKVSIQTDDTHETADNLKSMVADDQFPSPLVFLIFSRQSRPLAWKNADLKIQTILPLPGVVDATTTKTVTKSIWEKYGSEWRIVKVSLALDGIFEDDE
eukprot:scaffold168_cov53-Attheya_sp.AAC.5